MKLLLSGILMVLYCVCSGQNSEEFMVTDSDSIASLRHAIQDYVFGDEEIPEFVKNPEDNKYLTILSQAYPSSNMKDVESGTVTLKHGFTSRIYLFHPVKSNGLNIPVIYHAGHGYSVLQEDEIVNFSGGEEKHIKVIDYFLSRGFDVIGIDMPFFGANQYPTEVLEGERVYPMFGHDYLFNLQHPFYYFLAPVRSAMDYFQKEKSYDEFIMVGLSGGGWTTTLYSAMDTRIKLSFPVAGSIPIALRTNPNDWGDMEQHYAPFYDRFSYNTLYFLGSSGKGRMQYQILNKYDDCCFAFDGNRYWADSIRQALKNNNDPGRYEFFYDTYSLNHRISAVAVDTIYHNIIRYMVTDRLKARNPLTSSRTDNSICDNDTLLLSVPVEDFNTFEWFRDNLKLNSENGYRFTVDKKGHYFARIINLSGAEINTDTIYVEQLFHFKKPVISRHSHVLTSSFATGNQWYLNNKLLVNEKGQNIDAEIPGSYVVIVSSGTCVSERSEPYEIGVSIFPNPATTQLNVRIPKGLGKINYDISNMSGIMIGRGQFYNNETISLPTGLPAGMYYLKLTGQHDFRLVQKFRIR